MDVAPSPDRVFDFPEDALAPHLAYDFFAPGLIPGYARAPVNMNEWIKEDGTLKADLMEPIVDPVVDEMEEQMIALVIDVEEELAMLFGDDDDFSDNDLEGYEDDEAGWEAHEEWLMAPVTPPSMPVVPPSSTYKVGGSSSATVEGYPPTLMTYGAAMPPSVIDELCTHMGN
ncbi:hypothetical protein Tco_0238866, partial [Tanacetum coccineum]